MKSKGLRLILCVALAARVAVLLSAWNHPGDLMAPDSFDYLDLSHDLPAFESRSMSEIFRPPGYPVFLSLSRLGDPHDLQAIGNWRLVVLVQVLLDTALVGLTYSLGRRILDHRAGLLAASFQALTPASIASSCRLLSDSLFAFLVTGSLLLIVRHLQDSRATPPVHAGAQTGEKGMLLGPPVDPVGGVKWRWLLASAAVMGISCYVRTVGLTMAAAFFLVLLLTRKGLLRAGVFAAVVLACLAPWVVRNALVADYVGFSSVASRGLYEYSAPRVLARANHISLDKANEEIADDFYSYQAAGGAIETPGQLANYQEQYALRLIKDHSWIYVQVHLAGDIAFWLPDAPDMLEVLGLTRGGRGTLSVFQEKGLRAAIGTYFGDSQWALWVAAPMVLIFFAKLVGVVDCAMRRFHLRMRPEVWLMVLLAVLCALLAVPAAHPRFRVPIEPLLSLAAAAGWLAMLHMRSPKGLPS